jgi:hypothetical protein
MVCFYIDAATEEEKQLLSGTLRDDYTAYKARVGILGPRGLSVVDSGLEKRKP